jgi:glutamate-1-semialdehyde 2,1-aminomutase
MTLYERANRVIPGGSNLFSKRPELYCPGQWPSHFWKADGAFLWDLQGRKYLDMSTSGIGACVLGYADPDVDNAVKAAISRGVVSSLNCPEEVDLAERLIELHPWADMVKFTRSGGEAMAVAVRIAQAYSEHEGVIQLHGSYHGWHINNPLTGEAFVSHDGSDDIAAVLIEEGRNGPYDLEFAQCIHPDFLGDTVAAVVADEITTGFRFGPGGAHITAGFEPDIAVFGKALANGYAMGAVIGKRDVMMAAEKTFISSTSWTERIGPVAALATIQKFQDNGVHKHLEVMGRAVQECWKECANRAGLDVTVTGPPALSHLVFPSRELETLFTQEMLKFDILATNLFYPTYAHRFEHVEAYGSAVRGVFERLASKNPPKLEGPVRVTGIR